MVYGWLHISALLFALAAPSFGASNATNAHAIPGMKADNPLNEKVHAEMTMQETADLAFCALKAKCKECHQDTKNKFTDILKNGTLQKVLQKDGLKKLSVILENKDPDIGPMPPPSAKPLEEKEKAAIENWVNAGGPAWNENHDCAPMTGPMKRPITVENAVYRISRDLYEQSKKPVPPGQRAPNYRYFSFAELRNTPGEKYALATAQAALRKWLNYASNFNASEILLPEEVPGSDGYLWRVDINKLGWSPLQFSRMKQGDPMNKVAGDMTFTVNNLALRGRMGRDLYNPYVQAATQFTIPGELFLDKSTGGATYRDLVGLPATEQQYLRATGVNRQMELGAVARNAIRALQGLPPLPIYKPAELYAVITSKAEAANRQVEYHEFTTVDPTTGGLVKHQLFRTSNHNADRGNNSVGDQNILQRPLTGVPITGNPAVDANVQTKPADHDDLTYNNKGLPVFVNYQDNGQLNAENAAHPLFCITCHTGITGEGVYAFHDQGRSALAETIPNSPTLNNPAMRAIIEAEYPGDKQLQAHLNTFRRAYHHATDQLGQSEDIANADPYTEHGRVLERENGQAATHYHFGGDPVNATVQRYRESKGLEQIAGMVGTTPENVLAAIGPDPFIRQYLGSLLSNRDAKVQTDQLNLALPRLFASVGRMP